MFKKIRPFILIIITILCADFYSNIKVFSTPTQTDGNKTVLIDPGHGGMDGGAVSKNGIIEKHINLKISLKIRDRLKKFGYQVVMTRETDKGIYIENIDINKMKSDDLNNRCKIKRESNCDLFISIHQNYFTESNCKGPQIWYSKNEESSKFAYILQENLNNDLNYSKRKIKEANGAYKILRCYTNIPSVIIECGFLPNPEEENKLKSEVYQDKVAESISNSIKEYFEINY